LVELRSRMLAMIIFFLSSMYLTNLFASKIVKAREDENFGDGDYKKLFEYEIKVQKMRKRKVKKVKQKKKGEESESSTESEDEGDRI